jgi:hypothetical protein
LSGFGGQPSAPYIVLSSTNISLPLTSWSASSTYNFDGSGNFSVTNALDVTKGWSFYAIKLQ